MLVSSAVDQGAVIEPIPDSDQISRGCSVPPGVDAESVFVFKSDSSGARVESVIWRKYAPTLMEVHERGCARTKSASEKRAADGKDPKIYMGSMTSLVRPIRLIRTGRGFGFAVVHLPENGDNSHAHICMEAVTASSMNDLKKNDRRELIHLLFKEFGKLEPHSCL